MKRPERGVGGEMDYVQKLYRHRKLIWDLTLLDLRIRYAGSTLGFYWMILNPLLILLVYVLVFGFVLKIRPDPAGGPWDYTLLVFCGLLPWIGFSEGLARGTASVLSNRSLIKSMMFPVELIPITSVLASLLSQIVSMGVLLVLLSVSGYLGAMAVFLPVMVGLQVVFTVGLVWFLSCINVVYRDTSQIIGVMIMLLMVLSPIAYTDSMIPPHLKPFLALNPLYHLINGYRDILFFNRIPDMAAVGVFSLVAVLLLTVGHRFFMRLKTVFADIV